ncbi:DotH/IcmK family type IV secretion protein [Aeromonas veronii]|uniref:DotH/IcmK family type IV secretion protein n=1 Tax=Aeromonas veronii TaxID=654 RepID=UPI0031596E3A
MKNHFKRTVIACALCSFVCLSVSANGNQEATGQTPPIPDLPLPPVAEKAFDNVQTATMPLTPDQVRELRKRMDEMEQAASEMPRFVPVQETRQVVVDLRPGSVSPVVRLWPGYITSLMFVDEVGQPVYVMDVSQPTIAGKEIFSIDWGKNKEQRTHIIRMGPNSTYARGNISLQLNGVVSPVSLTVISGQRSVDDRVDLRIRGLNIPTSGIELPSDADPDLLPVLSGITPQGATQLKTSSDFVSAWKKGAFLYLRVSGVHMSPAPLSMRVSADGTQAVKVPLTTRVTVSIGGNRSMIRIEGV